MHIYQIRSDSVEIIDIGSEGVLLANDVHISSVFAGSLYAKDEVIGTLMCRREVATTNEFMRTLDNALAKYNSTDYSVKAIMFQTGWGTKTKRYYDQMTDTPHGTHSETKPELMDNLNKCFSIEQGTLRKMLKMAPGDNIKGRSSKLTVYANGRTEISLVRHLEASHYVRPSMAKNGFYPLLQKSIPAPPAIRTVPQQSIVMDETINIKKGSRGTMTALDMQVCSVFVGKLFRRGHYKGTIMCRRGIGASHIFDYSLKSILRSYHNHNDLDLNPIVIMAGITTDTMVYKESCKSTGTHLPSVIGHHARTDEELISNLSRILKTPEYKLKNVSRVEYGIPNQMIGFQVTVDSYGNLHFRGEKQALAPMIPLPGPSGTVPSATATSASIPPRTALPLSPTALGALPILDILDDDFL